MATIDERILEEVRGKMGKMQLSQAELARRTGLTPTSVSYKFLHGNKVTPFWSEVLDILGLELKVVEKAKPS